jgi:hypothetical protein
LVILLASIIDGKPDFGDGCAAICVLQFDVSCEIADQNHAI